MKYIILILSFFVCAISHAQTKTAGKASSQPNVVFIMVDDLGWKDPGFMGNTYHETPNMDRLSKEGMVFTNAYSNAPNCAPTRASLMSGCYAPRHGVYTVGNPERGSSKHRKLIPETNTEILDSAFLTLPEALKSAGYKTGMFGKWHLGNGRGTSPEGQGFDVNIGGNNAGSPRSYFSPYKNANIKDGPTGENLTDRLTDEAINFIENNQHDPFFVYLPYYAVHIPLQGKQELIEKYKNKTSPYERSNATYGAVLENLDLNIGKLLAKITQLKLDDNTLIIFTSDNGPYFPVSTAAPLRGTKGNMYEGGVRVPMIAKWTGKIKAGATNASPIISIDFFPTLLKICSIKKPAGKVLDGVDISPVLFSKAQLKPRNLYWHFPSYLQNYAGMKDTWRASPSSSIRKGDWKLIEYFEDGKLELFNLKKDVGEKTDLSKTNMVKAKELLKDLRNWRQLVKAPVPTELNPEYEGK